MESLKYIGFDVHQSTISVAMLHAEGKLVMQSVLVTGAAAILDFVHGLRGTLHVTFEEGTHSAWLYDLLVPHVARVVVCNPHKNALLKAGNKSDSIDARKLAELLRAGLLSAVYHGQSSTMTLRHLERSYTALTEDTTLSAVGAAHSPDALPTGFRAVCVRRFLAEPPEDSETYPPRIQKLLCRTWRGRR